MLLLKLSNCVLFLVFASIRSSCFAETFVEEAIIGLGYEPSWAGTIHWNKQFNSSLISRNTHDASPVSPCSLFIAPSLIPNAGMGIFTGQDIEEGATIGEPEMYITLADKFKTIPYRGQHRWLSWLNYVRGTTNFLIPQNKALATLHPRKLRRSATGPQFLDDLYRVDAFAPGLAALSVAHPKLFNMALIDPLPNRDNMGMHRKSDPGTGAFTAHHGAFFVAEADIPAGSELYLEPTTEKKEEVGKFPKPESSVSPKWLEHNGVCIDNLRVGPSTIKHAGRGAFAKRFLPAGSLIAPSNLAILKRDDLVIFEADESAKQYEKVLKKDTVRGHELLLNYCFGHPDSSLLFLPLSPVVNFINHHRTAPNVAIRWPQDTEQLLKAHPLELIDMSGKPMIEFVALRDIEPDEELLLDYGYDWDLAWKNHVKSWNPTPEDAEYVSAEDYLTNYNFTLRTTEEQKEYPYPSNLQLVCIFKSKKNKKSCILPCDIDEKMEIEGELRFTVSYLADKHAPLAKRMIAWDVCGEDNNSLFATGLSQDLITVMDKWEMLDQHLETAFRHNIGVPKNFFPTLWMEPTLYEISPAPNLRPGEHVAITWKHNGKPITRNALYVGLPPGFNSYMYDFAERMGVMNIFRDVLRGRPNTIGTHRYVDLNEGQYYVQRPHWNSNMHWIIPNDEVARKSYLKALGKGGFDTVLDSIGTSFGMEKLTCFHNTFLGISFSDDSVIHSDFYETQRRSFDFLLPIIMANSSNPEFHIQSLDGNIVVGLKYQYGIAVSVGDWTMHKSAPCDYTDTEEIRVVCSIYCSDIREENRKSLLFMYNQEHPAPFHHLFDMPVKEWHWDHDGRKLPR
jgi:SET domain